MAFSFFAGRATAFRSVLGFTFSHWRAQRLRAFAIAATMGLATLADILTPLYSGRLVDAIAKGGPTDEAAVSAALSAFAILVALALWAAVMRYVCFSVLVAFTIKMMRVVIGEAFARVQRFSTDWHASSFAGSTVRKVTRGVWALDLLNDTLLIALLPAAAMLIGTAALLGWHWPVMGLVTGLGSLAYLGLTVTLSLGYVAPAASLSNAWDTRLGGALADAISCNSVVKAFGAETREDGRLAWITEKWGRRTRRAWMRGTINGTAQLFALLALRALLIGLALVLWTRGQADAGDLAFVLTSFFILQGYLREMGMHIRNLQRSVNDMEELVELQRHPLGVLDRPAAKPLAVKGGEIVFDRVTFHYGAHAEPLYRDFSLKIAAGERVGLVGHSGSGKTTFVKLVQRLYDVTGGRILIDGENIADVEQASLRGRIAIVQQEPILFHRSLAENIAYGRPSATMDEVAEAAELASAHDFIARMPNGYGTLVGERGVKLSGGERQRVALARAFLADAPILVLDEATSSLDSESEMLIQQAMERLMVGRTTIVIAHRLSTVRALDRLLVFDRGRVVEEGDHEPLAQRTGGIYRRLFERQAMELVKGLSQPSGIAVSA
ncbi:ABC transporter ATP-binding protein [Consotaella salsifontis]|uniref:ATP-binding cassette, subfamily B n=1 Tax=Consotaella salsifontis TaxID=1365950 RepID=A0A1T4NZJ5_9HYPH|nr:ABC transporter ATP-binding protein [Consotaella salsifontis]SJZ84522.1 ATP-binding cassette, subfamily B [Consotaella salsifontis]